MDQIAPAPEGPQHGSEPKNDLIAALDKYVGEAVANSIVSSKLDRLTERVITWTRNLATVIDDVAEEEDAFDNDILFTIEKQLENDEIQDKNVRRMHAKLRALSRSHEALKEANAQLVSRVAATEKALVRLVREGQVAVEPAKQDSEIKLETMPALATFTTTLERPTPVDVTPGATKREAGNDSEDGEEESVNPKRGRRK